MKNIKTWLYELSAVGRTSLLATIVLGGLFTVSAISPTPTTIAPKPNPIETIKTEPVVTKKAEPVITTKKEAKTEIIPFEKQTIESSEFTKGSSQIQTIGINGTKTITYTIILTDGIETKRTSTETITSSPTDEITIIGTYVEPVSNCDPNYSGCVPIASDVDCAGGSGNGPAYTSGPVQVIGSDIYGLDRDNDGLGCE